MKANRKFKDEEAVSAVIGVILMVAITVAIAATVYVYVSGMMGGSTQRTPSITFTMDESANTLTVVSADSGVAWSDIFMNATADVGTNYSNAMGQSGDVQAGDTINFDGLNLDGDITIVFRHDPTNSLLGSYRLNSVT